MLALQLNVDFSAAGLSGGSSATALGDVTLCNFPSLPALNNITVSAFLASANSALGGGAGIYSVDIMDGVANALNAAFSGGSVSSFAQDHLVNGACP